MKTPSAKQRIMLFRLFHKACKRQAWQATNETRYWLTAEALKESKSWKQLSNGDVDRVKSLLEHFAEPDDLDARINLNDPERKERERLIIGIEQAAEELGDDGEAYVETVCEGKSGNHTRNWRSLPIVRLRQLHITIKERAKAQRRAEEIPVVHGVLQPF